LFAHARPKFGYEDPSMPPAVAKMMTGVAQSGSLPQHLAQAIRPPHYGNSLLAPTPFRRQAAFATLELQDPGAVAQELERFL
jgi:hypothetical protein